MPPSLPLQHVYGALGTQIDCNGLDAMTSMETFSVEYGIRCYKEEPPLREQDVMSIICAESRRASSWIRM
ncbi:hypothetical protein NEOLEDRAFT_154726 [Neolentinus lepideus HHB14362 ss-1]|uniref:Uncharacterized protein n=1 Tax=Neolentinus lepideus HHB14362 ss-1 TaxID=1314782 RepID=A0A165ML86_9AGAM|nr:hypothetical protein NEOLEDRAFT_154726 [Neolentinus lepideus HHB14362 ss-1]